MPSSSRKILIGPSSFSEIDPSPLRQLSSSGFQVVPNPFKRKLTKPELLRLLKEEGVVGIIAGLEPLDREVLSASKLRVVSRCGTGRENVDLAAANELGIKVYSTPEAPVHAVAEMTVGVMISLLRMLPVLNAELHASRWSKKIGTQLEGKTVAIVGFGKIGRRVAELLTVFKTRLLIVDPFVKDTNGLGQMAPLEKALAEADIVTLHCSDDRSILNENEFEMMKPSAYLLNSARGHLINEKALVAALKTGKIAGAWLDVFNEEPYKGPLTEFPQVILTPHASTYTVECRKAMENEAVRNLIRGFE